MMMMMMGMKLYKMKCCAQERNTLSAPDLRIETLQSRVQHPYHKASHISYDWHPVSCDQGCGVGIGNS